MENAIKLLHHNGFNLYYPFYITLDIDITQFDEDNNKNLNKLQK